MTTDQTLPALTDIKPNPHPCAPKYVDVYYILELANKGLAGTEIAKIIGISKQAVNYHIKKHRTAIKGLKYYKSNRADILALKGKELLESLTPQEIKKMPPGSRVNSFGILYDKERLERDQSTQNIASFHALKQDNDSLIDREAELQKMLEEA